MPAPPPDPGDASRDAPGTRPEVAAQVATGAAPAVATAVPTTVATEDAPEDAPHDRHPGHPGHLDPAVDTGEPDEEGVPKDRPRGIVRRMLHGVVSYGLVVAILLFLVPKLRATEGLGDAIALISPAQLVVMTVLGLLNLATNLPPIVITLPGLRFREAGVTNCASAAVSNSVPEGGAVATGLNFAMLRSWGFRLDAITSSYLTTGVWTNLVRYGLLAVALLVMSATGTGGWKLAAVAVVVTALVAAATALFIAVLSSERFAAWLGRLLGRLARPIIHLLRKPPVDDMDQRVIAFRVEMLGLVRTRWHALTLAMVVSQLTTCLVLGVALRMQGVGESEVSWARIIAAFGITSLASLIVPTPGGLGVAEVVLVSVLSAGVPDTYQNQITAAVLLYRYATWLLPIPIGAGTYLFWRYNHSWRTTPEAREADAAAPAVAAATG